MVRFKYFIFWSLVVFVASLNFIQLFTFLQEKNKVYDKVLVDLQERVNVLEKENKMLKQGVMGLLDSPRNISTSTELYHEIPEVPYVKVPVELPSITLKLEDLKKN